MFKKLFLLVFLIALLVGVSYYKTTLNDDKMELARLEGEQWADHTVAELKRSQDSLAGVLDSTGKILATTMVALDTVRLTETDSLRNLIADQEQKIADLTPAKAPATQAKVIKKKTSSNLHKEILADYKRRYQSLPKDLSAYERRVALSEIREESASKFKISVDQLNKIRKDYNLTY